MSNTSRTLLLVTILALPANGQHQNTIGDQSDTSAPSDSGSPSGTATALAPPTTGASSGSGSNDSLYQKIEKDYRDALSKVKAGGSGPQKLIQTGQGQTGQGQTAQGSSGASAPSASAGPMRNYGVGAKDSSAAINDTGKGGGGGDALTRQQIANNNRNMGITDMRDAFMGPACEINIAGGQATVTVPKTGLAVRLPIQPDAATQQVWENAVNYKFRDVNGPQAMAGLTANAQNGIVGISGNTLPLGRWGVTNDLSNYYYGDRALVQQADAQGGYAGVTPGNILLRVGTNSSGQRTCAVIGGK